MKRRTRTLLLLALSPPLVAGAAEQHLTVCHHYGCAERKEITLSAEEWNAALAHFQPRPADAAAERAAIAQAIGALERSVGPKTGTDRDIGGTFTGFAKGGQMDCIDESTNTTTYLKLLDAAGALHFHGVETPVTRGFFIFGWPHTSAAIRDRTSGERYVVDSWFRDNGHPADIVTVDQWRGGWSPPTP